MKEWMDFSSIPPCHPIYQVWRSDLPSEKAIKDELLGLRETNRNRLGYYKDELNGMATKDRSDAFSYCQEIISLRPKCYGIHVVASDRDISGPNSAPAQPPSPTPTHSICRAKGVKRSLITDKIITLDNYRQTLITRHPQRHVMTQIQSVNHTLYIQDLHKVSMSLWCNKRRFFNKYHSDPYYLPPSLHKPLMWPENIALEGEIESHSNGDASS